MTRHDDLVLATLLVVIGLARLVPGYLLGQSYGAESTIAALMVIGGLAIVIRRR